MEEIWRNIEDFKPGFSGYRVSNFGAVESCKKYCTNRILKTSDKGQYPIVRLYDDHYHQYFAFSVHELVADAFLGSKPSITHIVHHKDGNKHNPRVDNLEYITRSENLKHAYKSGAIIAPGWNWDHRGENCPTAKLSNNDAREIRRLYATRKYKQIELAAMFNVSDPTISRVVNYQIFKEI